MATHSSPGGGGLIDVALVVKVPTDVLAPLYCVALVRDVDESTRDRVGGLGG